LVIENKLFVAGQIGMDALGRGWKRTSRASARVKAIAVIEEIFTTTLSSADRESRFDHRPSYRSWFRVELIGEQPAAAAVSISRGRRVTAARPDLLRYDELIMAGATALEPHDER
jgi:chorismate-pyruvate lyase